MERPPRAGPALRHCSEPNTAGSIAGVAENAANANNMAVRRNRFMDGNYIAPQKVARAHGLRIRQRLRSALRKAH